MYPVRAPFGKWGDARLDEPANFGMPVETRAGDTAGEIESGVGCPSQEAKAFFGRFDARSLAPTGASY